MLAIIRPGSWNILLLIHVAGAMALVAVLILSTFAVRKAAASGDQPSTRFAFRTLLMGALPAFIVMRVGAQLIQDKEHVSDKLTWLNIGFIASDLGMLLLIVTLVLTGLAARKAKGGTTVAGSVGLRAASVLTTVLVAAYVVAIFAMTAKPD